MFITFEGMDGSGKTTQMRILAERLKAEGIDILTTREPGGSPSAEAIRRLVVEGEVQALDPETELLLFTAARRDHMRVTINPALEQGKIVLCDRFIDSTYALQGAGGVDNKTIADLHNRFVGRDPDAVLFFVLDEETSLERAFSRGGEVAAEDRMERKGLPFHQKVATILKERSQMSGRVTIDASGSIEEVSVRVYDAIKSILMAKM